MTENEKSKNSVIFIFLVNTCTAGRFRAANVLVRRSEKWLIILLFIVKSYRSNELSTIRESIEKTKPVTLHKAALLSKQPNTCDFINGLQNEVLIVLDLKFCPAKTACLRVK